MTMTIDNQQRFGGMNFDHMPYSNSLFTNPYSSPAPSQNPSLYAPSHNTHSHVGLENLGKQQTSHMSNNTSMASYAGVPITAPSPGNSLLADVYGPQELLTTAQDLLSPARSATFAAEAVYPTAPSPVHRNYAANSSPYDTMGYVPASVRTTYGMPQQENSRRPSQPGMQNEPTRDFGDAIDASRGMIAMSQNTTPRNIYGAQGRTGKGSGDSYGFPSTHSSSSSISSSSNYPSYFGGSVDSPASDYSNAGSDIESASSRTLPRPSRLLNGGLPPAPQSMMGQFSSKVSASTQKKHKCKVCDKRFTRPSSLQTHMYSHTGEKPFCCEIDGCGRHFSVVSNLRRHKKVHKGEARSDAGSEDHQSDEETSSAYDHHRRNF